MTTKTKWLKTWCLAVFLATAIIGSLEAFWREHGHLPSVVDDKDLWAFHRQRADSGGSKTLVLCGASRMQLDISLDALKGMVPDYAVAQLAIDGAHPVAVLRDLAGDNKFCGIVLCSMIASGFETRNWDQQQPYVDYVHHGATLNNTINKLISARLQATFTLLDPYLKLKGMTDRFLNTGHWPGIPKPKYLTTRFDRSRQADYGKLEIESHRTYRIQRLKEYYDIKNVPVDPEEWLKQAKKVEPFVKAIQSRGGKVVFIRLPTAGEHWELDERYYPKHLYWDRFAAFTAAETIHFGDFPQLSRFELPDTSHLDFRDTRKFTISLIEILKEKKLFADELKIFKK
jgi:hypothetical protein